MTEEIISSQPNFIKITEEVLKIDEKSLPDLYEQQEKLLKKTLCFALFLKDFLKENLDYFPQDTQSKIVNILGPVEEALEKLSYFSSEMSEVFPSCLSNYKKFNKKLQIILKGLKTKIEEREELYRIRIRHNEKILQFYLTRYEEENNVKKQKYDPKYTRYIPNEEKVLEILKEDKEKYRDIKKLIEKTKEKIGETFYFIIFSQLKKKLNRNKNIDKMKDISNLLLKFAYAFESMETITLLLHQPSIVDLPLESNDSFLLPIISLRSSLKEYLSKNDFKYKDKQTREKVKKYIGLFSQMKELCCAKLFYGESNAYLNSYVKYSNKYSNFLDAFSCSHKEECNCRKLFMGNYRNYY